MPINPSSEFECMEWDEKKVKTFFDFLGERKDDNNYFSKQRGKAVIRKVERIINIEEPILDFGCGKGYFLEFLDARKRNQETISALGVDLSAKSIIEASQRLKEKPEISFRDMDSFPIQDFKNYSKTTFLIEVIEHLLDKQLSNTLSKLNQLTAIGGKLIITTPFNEILESRMACCENCKIRFHFGQHVRNFNQDSLSTLLNDYGFKPIFCKPVLLLPNLKIWLKAQYEAQTEKICPQCQRVVILSSAKNRLIKIFKETRHLLYVGEKTRP